MATLKKLWLYRRVFGSRSFDALVNDLLMHPDMIDYLLRKHAQTAFQLESLGWTPKQIELGRRKESVRNDG